MNCLRIDWEIPRGRYFDERRTTKISEVKYNCDWTIQCVWSNHSVPISIKICRKTADVDLVITGNLALFWNGTQILQEKFRKLMESASTCVEIKLKNVTVSSERQYSNGLFSLKGQVIFSPHLGNKDYALSPLLGLAKDFKQLLDTETSRIPPDVNLKCGNDYIPAHKLILSARSPVFAAMFANPDTIESQKNEVVITDVDCSIMRNMVTYMYTGCQIIGERVAAVCDLMVAADKYQVLSLKTECCMKLKKMTTLQNALLLLDIGDSISAHLKSFVMNYICECREFPTLQNSEAWKLLETEKPALAIEVLSSLVKSKDKTIERFKVLYEQAMLGSWIDK